MMTTVTDIVYWA